MKASKQNLEYFPDKFLKRTPPTEYFWKIFATRKPLEFAALLAAEAEKIKKKKPSVNQSLTIIQELKDIYEKVDLSNDLSALRIFKSRKKT